MMAQLRETLNKGKFNPLIVLENGQGVRAVDVRPVFTETPAAAHAAAHA